ncbi:hypothetical protein [Roseixanthobacter pseudopolyaromaticivorans]|uniref:hypothetical protein n=1 Tax=Xanthobacteraceae TaxID=335928 RepID=UPI00372CD9B4
MTSPTDLKARANAAFAGQQAAPTASPVDQAADAAHEKIARLKALREAREKAEADRAEAARQKARRARSVKG